MHNLRFACLVEVLTCAAWGYYSFAAMPLLFSPDYAEKSVVSFRPNAYHNIYILYYLPLLMVMRNSLPLESVVSRLR